MDGYNQTKIYEQGRLTFEVRPKIVIVRTPLQAFYLVPRQYRWHKKIKLMRSMIELGKMEDLNQLAGFCGDKIEWRATSIKMDADAIRCDYPKAETRLVVG